MEERGKLALLALIALALPVLFLGLGAYPLLDPDEARFARTSVEMVRSHDYVVPTFEGEPRLVKPPLLHWIQAALFRVVGPSELMARFPAAVSTFVSLLLVAWIGWRRFGVEGSAWSAAFFLTFPLVVLIARIGSLDALLSVHILAVLALDLVQPEGSGLQRSAVIGGLLGLAFMVKGPVGILLPLVMMLAGRTATGRDVLPTVKTAVTAALAASAVVLPWGLVFIQRVGASQASGTLEAEAFERYFAGTAHVEPWWFYSKIVGVAFLPWAAPLVIGTLRGLARWRDKDSPTGPYAAAGFLAGLIFFSLGKGKLPNYILPLAPFAALVLTFELGQELVHPKRRRLGPSLVATTLVALAVGLGAAAVLRLEDRARWVAVVGAVAFGLAAITSLVGMLKSAPRIVYAAAACGSLAFMIAVVAGLPPLVAEARSSKPLVDAVPELQSARPLVLLDMNLPSLTYYLDRVPEKLTAGRLADRIAGGDRPLIVADEADLVRLSPEVRGALEEIGRAGKLRVLQPRKSGE